MTQTGERVLPTFTQPVGTLPWPAGLLVLPDVEEGPAVAGALVRGERPPTWPVSLRFVEAALEGDTARAVALLSGDGVIEAYNRAVLVGDEQQWSDVADRCDDPDLAALTAVARYSLGLQDTLPPWDGLRAEVSALVLSALSSQALERAELEPALRSLQAAVAAATTAGSPVLAASLAATHAELLREDAHDPAAAADVATSALALLMPLAATPDVEERRADLRLTRALAHSELADAQPWLQREVVRDLQDALTVFTEDAYPERFAESSQHLALAYLVVPMSGQGDRIRSGVAVNALRGALRVYDREHHPVAWASTTLNLANALQYLPSALPEQHLTEAVDLYEQVLQTRDERTDPVGVGRTLANQANALAHLGAFVDAEDRLERAGRLFAAAGDDEGLLQVQEIRAGIQERATTAGGA